MSPSLEQTQLLLAVSTLRTHTAWWRLLGKYIWPTSGSLGKYLGNRLPTFALSKYCCDTEPTSLFIQRSFDISFSQTKGHSLAWCFLFRKSLKQIFADQLKIYSPPAASIRRLCRIEIKSDCLEIWPTTEKWSSCCSWWNVTARKIPTLLLLTSFLAGNHLFCC